MNDQQYDEQQVIEQVVTGLRDRFPQLDPIAVDRVAVEVVHELASAKIKNYVGPLAEHKARDVLHHAANGDLRS